MFHWYDFIPGFGVFTFTNRVNSKYAKDSTILGFAIYHVLSWIAVLFLINVLLPR